MSKFLRMIDVLDLFSGQTTLLTAEEMAQLLQVSRPTAFRYARELTAAGFLANYSGSYCLGSRIITLDYRIRESDPLLRIARAPMRKLAHDKMATVVLGRMYNEDIINVHQEEGVHDESIIGRGRPLPLFRGAASKTMLAHLPPAKLRKIYERHAQDPDAQRIGRDWESFRAAMNRIRREGHYVSIGEVSEQSIGIAAPIALPQVGVVAVLSLVLPSQRLPRLDVPDLSAQVRTLTEDIAAQLTILTLADEWGS